jgi:hypothetical protein
VQPESVRSEANAIAVVLKKIVFIVFIIAKIIFICARAGIIGKALYYF